MFHIHIILTLFEFGIQSFGLFVLYGTNPLSQSIICLSSYSEHKILFAYITIIWGFVGSIFWMIVIFIVVYNSMTSKTQNITKYNHIWQKRLEWFGIHKKLTNGTDVLTDVAETFADYLHDVDWAPSDYLVGLLLLKREHKQNRDSIQERRRQDFVNQKRIIQNLANDSTILGSSIIHSTTTERPIDAFLAPLWESIKNYTPFNQNTPTNNGRMENNDSTFHQNKASFNTKYGFEVMTRDDIADILYFARYAEAVYSHENSKTLCGDKLLLFSNDNDLFKSPYLIARDDEWKVIVISIRGTYSAADWLVDLTIESVMIPIPELGDDKIHLTHGGILRTAKNILRQLQENDTLSNIMKDPSTLGYDIIVAGHSLGAVTHFN